MHPDSLFSGLLGAVRSLKTNGTAIAVAAFFALGPAGAAQAGGPGGTYLQGGYADWEDADDGYNIGGSLGVIPGVRLFADYTDTDLEQLRAGAGVTVPMISPLSFEIGGSYQRIESVGLDDDGLGIHGIARIAATPALTLAGKLEYVMRDDLENETVLGLDVDYRFMPLLSAFVSYDVYDEIDNDLLILGARLNF